MKVIQTLLAAGAAALLATGALASPGVTLVPTTLYAGPNPNAPFVMSIPPNASVNVEYCRRGWCRISWRYQAGFAPASNLQFDDTVYEPAPPPRVYVEPRVYAPPVIVEQPFYGPRPYRHYY